MLCVLLLAALTNLAIRPSLFLPSSLGLDVKKHAGRRECVQTRRLIFKHEFARNATGVLALFPPSLNSVLCIRAIQSTPRSIRKHCDHNGTLIREVGRGVFLLGHVYVLRVMDRHLSSATSQTSVSLASSLGDAIVLESIELCASGEASPGSVGLASIFFCDF
jgi:hypothetical protein